ncbi:MAG: hypothetical protein KAI24_21780, partial [Planctomycetes bacterium]|nr:hypothetical protein [Planctomycetota bacterium]
PPVSDELIQEQVHRLSESLASASHRLELLEGKKNLSVEDQWSVHNRRFACLKYYCEIACLEAGLYWVFEPGAAMAVNRQLNEATKGQCWFIHLASIEVDGRSVGIVVYVPHSLFPEIEIQRREQARFYEAHARKQ